MDSGDLKTYKYVKICRIFLLLQYFPYIVNVRKVKKKYEKIGNLGKNKWEKIVQKNRKKRSTLKKNREKKVLYDPDAEQPI